MPKRIEKPEVVDDCKYFTAYKPYPPAANMEFQSDRMDCAFWLASVVQDPSIIRGLYHRQETPSMVIISIEKDRFDDERERSLLGRHSWAKFLLDAKNDGENNTDIFYCVYKTHDEVSKYGWKFNVVDPNWFNNNWVPDNCMVRYPYPLPIFCEPPIGAAGIIQVDLCHHLPARLFPENAKIKPKVDPENVPRVVPGSASWRSAQASGVAPTPVAASKKKKKKRPTTIVPQAANSSPSGSKCAPIEESSTFSKVDTLPPTPGPVDRYPSRADSDFQASYHGKWADDIPSELGRRFAEQSLEAPVTKSDTTSISPSAPESQPLSAASVPRQGALETDKMQRVVATFGAPPGLLPPQWSMTIAMDPPQTQDLKELGVADADGYARNLNAFDDPYDETDPDGYGTGAYGEEPLRPKDSLSQRYDASVVDALEDDKWDAVPMEAIQEDEDDGWGGAARIDPERLSSTHVPPKPAAQVNCPIHGIACKKGICRHQGKLKWQEEHRKEIEERKRQHAERLRKWQKSQKKRPRDAPPINSVPTLDPNIKFGTVWNPAPIETRSAQITRQNPPHKSATDDSVSNAVDSNSDSDGDEDSDGATITAVPDRAKPRGRAGANARSPVQESDDDAVSSINSSASSSVEIITDHNRPRPNNESSFPKVGPANKARNAPSVASSSGWTNASRGSSGPWAAKNGTTAKKGTSLPSANSGPPASIAPTSGPAWATTGSDALWDHRPPSSSSKHRSQGKGNAWAHPSAPRSTASSAINSHAPSSTGSSDVWTKGANALHAEKPNARPPPPSAPASSVGGSSDWNRPASVSSSQDPWNIGAAVHAATNGLTQSSGQRPDGWEVGSTVSAANTNDTNGWGTNPKVWPTPGVSRGRGRGGNNGGQRGRGGRGAGRGRARGWGN